MGRPPKLTKEVKDTIAGIKERHPGWSIRDIHEKIPQFNKSLVGKKVPGRTLIGDYLKTEYKINKLKVGESGIDAPWHLGASENKCLQPEDIAAIVEVQSWLEVEKNKPGTTSGIKEWTEYYTNNGMTTTIWPLTIREALWVVKLYKVNYNLTDPEKLYLKLYKHPIVMRRTLLESPSTLWYAVKTYSDYKRLCDLAGTNFDTTKLDDALRSGSIGKTKLDLFSEYKSKKDGKR